MKSVYSYAWLQSFFREPLPQPHTVLEELPLYAFEVESWKEEDGDVVFTLDIPPSRVVDCLAHYGIAKELAARYAMPLARHYFVDTAAVAREQIDTCPDPSIAVHTEKALSYTITPIALDHEFAAPAWMTKRLHVIGQRSVHGLVDVANYLLFDLGQPVHVFDAAKVSGAFLLREAETGETIQILGGESVALEQGDIVIVDEKSGEILGLAGIKGGAIAAVDAHTKTAYLEVAAFDAASVRATMRRTGIHSDAAQRFAQGYPNELIPYTTTDVCSLYQSCDGVHVGATHTVSHGWTGSPRIIGLAPEHVTRTLGEVYTSEATARSLARSGFACESVSARERFVAEAKRHIGTPYLYGASVTRDAPKHFDCSSLVAYAALRAGVCVPRISINQFLALEEIAAEDAREGDIIFFSMPDAEAPPRKESVFEERCPVTPGRCEAGVNHCGILLRDDQLLHAEGSAGANQVVVTSLREYEAYRAHIVGYRRLVPDSETGERLVVTVPIERVDVQRPVDLIEELARFHGYDQFTPIPPRERDTAPVHHALAQQHFLIQALVPLGFSEVKTYTFSKKGERSVTHPLAADKGCLRTDLAQGIREAALANALQGELLGLDEIRLVELGHVFTGGEEQVHIALALAAVPGRTQTPHEHVAKQVNEALSALSLPASCSFVNGVWETDFSQLIASAPEPDTYPRLPETAPYTAPSRFPFVLRDIAVFVPSDTEAARVQQCIVESAPSLLRRCRLFDTFEREGQVSYAFRLVFQSQEKTLTDPEVNTCLEDITQALNSHQGWTVR